MSRRMLVSCRATPRSSASESSCSVAGILAGAEDGQRQTADRAGHAAAVGQQVVDALVGERRARPCTRPRPGRETPRRGSGQTVSASPSAARTGSCDPGWTDSSELPDFGERDQLLVGGQIAVADVVDAPRHGVDGGEHAPFGRRQQPDAVPEVPGLAPGDRLAVTDRRAVGQHGGHVAPSPAALAAARRARAARARPNHASRALETRADTENVSNPRRRRSARAASPPAVKRRTASPHAARQPAATEDGLARAATAPDRPRTTSAAESARSTRRASSSLLAVPESLEVFERQVDAAHRRVLAEILQKLDELQPRAGGIRERREDRRCSGRSGAARARRPDRRRGGSSVAAPSNVS